MNILSASMKIFFHASCVRRSLNLFESGIGVVTSNTAPQ
jgi:hypothetical protein